MEVGERLKAGYVHGEDLQLVLGDVEASELPKGVYLLGQVDKLVVVQPQFCKRKGLLEVITLSGRDWN